MTPDDIKKWLGTPARYGYETGKRQMTLDYILQLEAGINRIHRQLTETGSNLVDIIHALAEQTPKWISVEDRLPEDDQDVLICVRGQTIDTGYYYHEYWVAYACMSSDVTHWMPLPELPDKG